MRCRNCGKEIVPEAVFGWTHVKYDGEGIRVADYTTRFCDPGKLSCTASPIEDTQKRYAAAKASKAD